MLNVHLTSSPETRELNSYTASPRSSEGRGFDLRLRLRNRFFEVRAWRTFIDHLYICCLPFDILLVCLIGRQTSKYRKPVPYLEFLQRVIDQFNTLTGTVAIWQLLNFTRANTTWFYSPMEDLPRKGLNYYNMNCSQWIRVTYTDSLIPFHMKLSWSPREC